MCVALQWGVGSMGLLTLPLGQQLTDRDASIFRETLLYGGCEHVDQVALHCSGAMDRWAFLLFPVVQKLARILDI